MARDQAFIARNAKNKILLLKKSLFWSNASIKFLELTGITEKLMRLIRLLLLVSTLFSLSCASYFKRKDCEKTNWFEHGNKVAMQGKRPDSDTFVNECKQVEANINWADLDLGFKAGMETYCKPKTVFDTGRKGEKFNDGLCDTGKLKMLQEQHKKGVRIFCKSSNGSRFGATGKVYNNICPEDMEEAFLVEYRKGRIRYLNLEIQQNRRQIRNLDRDISEKERELQNLRNRLAYLPVIQAVTNRPSANQALEEEERRKRQRQVDDLNYDIRSKSREIDNLRDQQNQLRDQIDSYENEITSLSQ